MLSIRMRRVGSKKRPFYRVVVAEARSPREGGFLEILGSYNPRSKPATVEIDRDRVQQWIKQGARPSDSVRTLLARHLTKDRGKVAATQTTGESAAAPASTQAPSAGGAAIATAAAIGVAGVVAAGLGIAAAITAARAEPAAAAAPDLEPPSTPAETPTSAPDTAVDSPS